MRKLIFAAVMAVVPLSPLQAQMRGPVTDLPIPRFVSMKAAEGYARRGPSREHRIDWVYKRRHMPVRIVDEYGHWRRVQDAEGQGGWMHYSLLSGTRTVLVRGERVQMRRKADPEAKAAAVLEHGVIAWLDRCEGGWCRIEAGARGGWVPVGDLWGIAPEEAG
ncbi:aspartyl-trna synthetase [Jannaschia sp. Os4]|uniref:SH3 domain-containing protein n=1 Tax=Jannaschia sp. Os4 TaxID=2807617 RepID=UPI0019397D81|nr:SH3 domain-containing protein [Jannaschia sp. Os4]MBM2575229.1 aspartyl-trna synthetase [Jannaschia sp. Os4]